MKGRYHIMIIENKKWRLFRQFRKQYPIHFFVWPGLVFLLIFSYVPMVGVIMAFKKYSISSGIMGIFTSPWVGFKNFTEFFNEINFWIILRNTLGLSILKTVFVFPIPILFAIMVCETRNIIFRKLVQTVSYLPHFISWVIVAGLSFTFFSEDFGVFNEAFKNLGMKTVPFLTTPDYFWFLAVITDVWKESGWWAIIFIAAITSIDQALFEAATIDGAGRIDGIRYIVLPSISGAISVVLILSLGNLLGGGLSGSNFEQCMLLGNDLNLSRSEIIQTYTLKVGLGQARYSYAAAVGLLQSVISVILIFGSNAFSKKFSGTGLF